MVMFALTYRFKSVWKLCCLPVKLSGNNPLQYARCKKNRFIYLFAIGRHRVRTVIFVMTWIILCFNQISKRKWLYTLFFFSIALCPKYIFLPMAYSFVWFPPLSLKLYHYPLLLQQSHSAKLRSQKVQDCLLSL